MLGKPNKEAVEIVSSLNAVVGVTVNNANKVRYVFDAEAAAAFDVSSTPFDGKNIVLDNDPLIEEEAFDLIPELPEETEENNTSGLLQVGGGDGYSLSPNSSDFETSAFGNVEKEVDLDLSGLSVFNVAVDPADDAAAANAKIAAEALQQEEAELGSVEIEGISPTTSETAHQEVVSLMDDLNDFNHEEVSTILELEETTVEEAVTEDPAIALSGFDASQYFGAGKNSSSSRMAATMKEELAEAEKAEALEVEEPATEDTSNIAPKNYGEISDAPEPLGEAPEGVVLPDLGLGAKKEAPNAKKMIQELNDLLG